MEPRRFLKLFSITLGYGLLLSWTIALGMAFGLDAVFEMALPVLAPRVCFIMAKNNYYTSNRTRSWLRVLPAITSVSDYFEAGAASSR
jgi:hypothetical protein